jgi:hypothetical protein
MIGTSDGPALTLQDMHTTRRVQTVSTMAQQERHVSGKEVGSGKRGVGSVYSLYSLRSAGSILSIVSWLSALSLFSFGSVGSVLSLFSAGSVLSFGSSGSTLSAFSNGCYMHIWTDCNPPKAHAEFQIRMGKDTFETMASCTNSMYAEYQSSDSYDDECGYQKVKCRHMDKENDTDTGFQDCQVRRKGSSTWREMGSKPSFKIKKFETADDTDVTYGDGWVSSKIMLNNMAHPGEWYQTWSEVSAYDTFRKLGKRAVPHAQYSTVSLIVDDTVLRTDIYSMVQVISDNEFMDEHFKQSWSLYEVEVFSDVQFKKSSIDAIDDEQWGDLLLDDSSSSWAINLPNQANITIVDKNHHFVLDLAYMDQLDAIRYYVGELITGHWDGACSRGWSGGSNNLYLGLEYSDVNITLIPSGLDQTFQSCYWWVQPSVPRGGVCQYMHQCFEDEQCTRMYESELADAQSRTDIRKINSCTHDILPAIILGIVLTPLSVLMGYSICKDRRQYSRIYGR